MPFPIRRQACNPPCSNFPPVSASTPEQKTRPVCRSQTVWAPTSQPSRSPARTHRTELVFCIPPTARSPRSSPSSNTQFQSILSEINQIGLTTNFNGTSVFGAAGNSSTSVQGNLLTTTPLTEGDTTTISDSKTGGTFVFTAGAGATIATLQTAITAAVTAGQLSAGTA